LGLPQLLATGAARRSRPRYWWVMSPQDRRGRLRSRAQDEGSARKLGRSDECEAVLKRYGLEHSSMAVIGADRLPESPDWRVMVTGGVQPQYLDVEVAGKLASDLRRIGERVLADRISAAVETAKRQTRPRDRRETGRISPERWALKAHVVAPSLPQERRGHKAPIGRSLAAETAAHMAPSFRRSCSRWPDPRRM
jgi:hypothetical protein